MADDSHENGTSNGDVPEIELIIKVSLYHAWSKDGEEGRDRKKRRSFRARYGRGTNEWFLFVFSSSFQYFFFFHLLIRNATETIICDKDPCASFTVSKIKKLLSVTIDRLQVASNRFFHLLFSSPF